MRTSFFVAVMTLAIFGVSSVRAQEQSTPADVSTDRDALRQRIEKRLDDVRKQLQSLEEGLKSLNSGGDIAPLRALGERRGGWRGGPTRGEDSTTREAGPISAQERETLLALLKETMPTLSARLDALREKDPQAAERMSGRLLSRLREAAELKEREPKLYALKIDELKAWAEVMAAAQALRERGDGADVNALRTKLRQAVAQQFDAREATQGQEIADLETRLRTLREESAQKSANRTQLIDEFMTRLEAARPEGSRRRNEGDRKE
jgi:hypothetical protein